MAPFPSLGKFLICEIAMPPLRCSMVLGAYTLHTLCQRAETNNNNNIHLYHVNAIAIAISSSLIAQAGGAVHHSQHRRHTQRQQNQRLVQ